MAFHLILTTDYELFGNGSGCLEKCLYEPTERLVSIADSYNAKVCFFVETLELACISALSSNVTIRQYNMITNQLQRLADAGHALELHNHPQWLNATFDKPEWSLAFEKWRIGDLTAREVQQCIQAGITYLSQFQNQPASVFRAGGWAIQPAEATLNTLSQNGLVIDSTVAPGMINPAKGDWYDFRTVPNLPFWQVTDDVCVQNDAGKILEIPITTHDIGVVAHFKALKETKAAPQFPAACEGSYAGPNSSWQATRGRLAKLANIGRVMLDFSTLPGWALIEVTKKYMARFATNKYPIPLVAIGHNKNFSQKSEENLAAYLSWVSSNPNIIFSDYRRFLQALQQSQKSAIK
ncbi:MAG: hypothetical protein KUG79_11840 [Pseudomonadales bacterium]|nr:hypothetical protein [Pseudomonadales bacterium]